MCIHESEFRETPRFVVAFADSIRDTRRAWASGRKHPRMEEIFESVADLYGLSALEARKTILGEEQRRGPIRLP
ncbi:hypothetical protein Dimus_022850 [Dionaea muscipula]